MALMAILAAHGVPPDVYDGMNPDVAVELGKRVISNQAERDEMWMKYLADITKIIVKSNGMRMF
jgi:hypothetical protein